MQGNLYALKYLKEFRNSTVWIQRTKRIPIIGQRYVAYIIIQKAETGEMQQKPLTILCFGWKIKMCCWIVTGTTQR